MVTRYSRLYTLDALRGVAAIIVLLSHLDNVVVIAPSGYLAVDFFFSLSGLVVARTYGERLKNGLNPLKFIRSRLIRFYPLFAIGLIIGLMRALSQVALNQPSALSLLEIGMSLLLGIVFLPSPTTLAPLFPLNGPAWSLFYELIVNALYGWIMVRASGKLLLLVWIALLLCLAFTTNNLSGFGVGGAWGETAFGLGRTFLSFFMGILLAKAIANIAPRESWLWILPTALVVTVLLVAPPVGCRASYDLLSASVALPLAVWLGARWNPTSVRLQTLAGWLGEISYPLYITHYSLIFAASYSAKRFHWAPDIWIPVLVCGLLAFSHLLSRYVDFPVRRYLSRRIDQKNVNQGIKATQS